MFATLISATLFFSIAVQSAFAADAFNIATPAEFTQCESTKITWSSGQAPYDLAVVPAADPCGDVLTELGVHNSSSLTWTVSLPAGTNVELSLLDANGEEAWSGAITVKDSNDTSCLTTANTTATSTTASERTTLTATGTGALAGTTSGAAQPAGAVNAGDLPTSGALSAHNLPSTAALLGVLAAFAAATL